MVPLKRRITCCKLELLEHSNDTLADQRMYDSIAIGFSLHNDTRCRCDVYGTALVFPPDDYFDRYIQNISNRKPPFRCSHLSSSEPVLSETTIPEFSIIV